MIHVSFFNASGEKTREAEFNASFQFMLANVPFNNGEWAADVRGISYDPEFATKLFPIGSERNRRVMRSRV